MRSLLIVVMLGALACASRQTAPTRGRGIAFVQNDLQGAFARARAESKPLFVDAWAPW
jgi:hypothetical protein